MNLSRRIRGTGGSTPTARTPSAWLTWDDATTGQGQAGNPIVVPDATVTTAERLNARQVPANFPARS